MEIDYKKIQENLANESLRVEFEVVINSLTAVKYSLCRDINNEYQHPAVFHMWTGYCMARAV